MNKWKESLIEYFIKGIKKEDKKLLGVEVEQFILDEESGNAVPYAGKGGVREILSDFMKYYPEAKVIKDDDFFGFSVPDFNISLEPASQFEISISPESSIERISEIYKDFYLKLKSVVSPLGYTIVRAGCQPVTPVENIKLIPKKRYDLMNAHFQSSGTGGIEMMRGTASVQVSVDYCSEEDFRRKIQAAHFYSPILKLLCDNSPLYRGRELRTFLKRTDIWRRVDPARCGILPGIFSESYGFADYADFIGNMAPIFLKEDMTVTPTGSKTTAELFDGKEMTDKQISHVLSMVFPDVRLKQFIEIRYADSVPRRFMAAYSAVIKGLMYNENALQYAEDMIRKNNLTESDIMDAEDDLMINGWRGVVYGIPAEKTARKIIAMAKEALPENENAFPDTFKDVLKYGAVHKIPENTGNN